MEIRSVTLFAEPTIEEPVASAFFESTHNVFHVPVQSRRLATTPFPEWWNQGLSTATQAKDLAAQWQAIGANYICFGPVTLHHNPGWLNKIPEIVGSSQVLFTSAEIADTGGQIDIGRCRSVAEIIGQLSRYHEKGFGNLFFTALANCHPSSPFFPVAYHAGGPPRFAIAVESADLAMVAIKNAVSLADARSRLLRAIEQEASSITIVAQELVVEHGIIFDGIDFSLAPYPTPEKSLGGAMEASGIGALGAPGTLFIAAVLADVLGQANYLRCGFSGIMLPVLEDSVVASRSGEGAISIGDLLSYASVCGVGLDTVPLPGDISEDAITAVLLDVAGLAVRLDKPLVARLMPIPGLGPGDPIHFDFPYFADGRVMNIRDHQMGRLLSTASKLELRPIHDSDTRS